VINALHKGPTHLDSPPPLPPQLRPLLTVAYSAPPPSDLSLRSSLPHSPAPDSTFTPPPLEPAALLPTDFEQHSPPPPPLPPGPPPPPRPLPPPPPPPPHTPHHQDISFLTIRKRGVFSSKIAETKRAPQEVNSLFWRLSGHSAHMFAKGPLTFSYPKITISLDSPCSETERNSPLPDPDRTPPLLRMTLSGRFEWHFLDWTGLQLTRLRRPLPFFLAR